MDQQNAIYKEEAIPFVIYNSELKKFELSDEAVDLLKSINTPIGLVAVAGMYRTGKSYLLNRMLLNRSNGFGVGPTINPCTKGLWIWGKPVPGFTPEGEPINVLIVDTEGLGALDEDSNHDIRIFSLAILLSSYFLYNSVGSIDESALSNLSLVINLTKHIQIKSRGGCEDIDTDEYSSYFPSFMWVVRDFTLQLVDQEGEALSSKEYLEKALETQKGFSDNVEQKNRIRRLLKSFFKERDCCTMIRPLTNEENLQKLAEMELDELRADFVEQIMQLRRKVINRVKPKVLNGKKLTGPMLATLSQSYVTAINNGAVPNIESAWNYICKAECSKAIDECFGKYEELIKDGVFGKIPMEEDELKDIYRDAKAQALQLFTKKSIGNVAEQYTNELKEKMQQLFSQVKEENERESQNQAEYFLNESYQFIERKLKNKEFQSFHEYEQDIKAFAQYFLENGPPGPYKRLIMADYLNRVIMESSDFFLRQTANDLELSKQIAVEHQKSLENQVKELKEDHKRDKDHYEVKMRNIESEKAELSALEQGLRETIERTQQEKKSIERELSVTLEEQRKAMLLEIEDYKNRLTTAEGSQADLQRQIYSHESENDKERALLEQKIEFLERSITDYQKKEEDLQSDHKTQKKEQQQLIRDMQTRYEQQLKTVQQKRDEFEEKYNEFQQMYEDIEQKYNFERTQWQDAQESMKNNVSISKSQYQDMHKTIDELKMKHKQEMDTIQMEYGDFKEQTKLSLYELQQSIKDKEDEMKSQTTHFNKEVAIYQQKLEFKDVQFQQQKSQLDESKKAHESMMKAIESRARESTVGKEYAQKQIEEMKQAYAQEMQELEHQSSQMKTSLEHQLEEVTNKYHDIDMRNKVLEAEFEKEKAAHQEYYEQNELLKAKLQEANKTGDQQKLRLLEETEDRYKEQINQLEKDIEELKYQQERSLSEVQTQSEESLAQLKNFYEQEKDRLEYRIQEEKERGNKKVSQLTDEYEQLLRDERQQHEEDIEMLSEELRDKDRKFQNYSTQMEHDQLLMRQRMETMDQQMREKEERFGKDQATFGVQIEQQMERFTQERKEMLDKIDTFNKMISQKDREVTLMKSKFDSLTEDNDKKKKMLDEFKGEYGQERDKLLEKIEQQRQKHQEISDEFIQKKLEDAREIALFKQKLEFKEKRIEDLQKQYEDQMQRNEEKLQQYKSEYQQDYQESQSRSSQLREQLEQKYERKRKQMKEAEQALQKSLTDLSREKAVLEEKFVNAEQTREEIRGKLEAEVFQLKEQWRMGTEHISKDREMVLQENERMRDQLQEMERIHSETSSAYDRDQSLWKEKFQFLEQQKDLAKQDLQEATRKFEMTLEQLQKRGNQEKDKMELSQNTLLSSIEQKYKMQIKEQIENNQRNAQELIEKNKYLEKENRQLQNRLQLEQRDKMSDHEQMEKKVQDLQENERQLLSEIDTLKNERDRKVGENHKVVEKEREQYKQRLAEMEIKVKESENRRSTMLFELEKERAKWGMERDQIVSQKQEAQEQMERMQKKQELLIKENEKLKNDRNNTRKQMMYGGGGAGTAGGPSGYTSKFTTQFGQTLMKSINSKENLGGGVSSSQAFAQGFSKFISDGLQNNTNEKVDPQQLPLSVKDANLIRMKSDNTNFLGFKSTLNNNKASAKGGSSTDETLSNQ